MAITGMPDETSSSFLRELPKGPILKEPGSSRAKSPI
jgi:hypothetical protein